MSFKGLPWIFVTLMLFAVGCSTVSQSSNRFVVDRSMARTTLENEHLGSRRIHRAQPLFYGSTIITSNSIDGILALDRKSGSPVWRIRIDDGVEAGAILADDILYFGAGDGLLYAAEPSNGKVLWTYPLKAEGIARPLVKNGVLYVLGGNNVAHALDAKSGKLLWTYNRREAGNLSIRGGAQPVIVGEMMILGFSDGAIVSLNKSSGALIWEVNLNRNKRFRDVDSTAVIDKNIAYVSSYDGSLYALNVSDGRPIWTIDEGGYDPVVLQGGILYYCSSTGKTFAIDKSSGKVLWSVVNPNGIASGPALFKNVLIVGEMTGAMRFLDARTGEMLNQFDPGWGVTSRALVDEKTNEVFFVSAAANLFALTINWRRFKKDWPWEL